MGAWGEKAFQNDSALDWLSELQARGVTELRGILSMVASTDPGEYLDVDDGSAAIAAAEIVAATLSHGRDRLTREGMSWLEANASGIGAEDVALAHRAVERVLVGSSELRDLWDEGGIGTEWHADVRVLLVRLGGDVSVLAPRVNDATQEEERTEGAAHIHSKHALFAFLMMRGLEATEAQRARISASRDPEELRRWLRRVVNAPSVADMLDE
jgi:hypothetical protein